MEVKKGKLKVILTEKEVDYYSKLFNLHCNKTTNVSFWL